jgi:hypothetical protein
MAVICILDPDPNLSVDRSATAAWLNNVIEQRQFCLLFLPRQKVGR